MTLPLIILAIFSIFFGFLFKDAFIGMGSNFFLDNSIYIHYLHEINIDTEFAISTYLKLLPFVITIIFIFIYVYIYEKSILFFYRNTVNRYIYNIYCFLSQRFFVELIYNKYVSEYILNLGSHTTKILDKGSVEYIGPYGLEKGLVSLSNTLSKLDSGKLNYYSLYILCGLVIYVYLWEFTTYKEYFLIVLLNAYLFINKKS